MTPKQRLRKYIEWRKQARGIDHEHIHGFSPGSPSEATLLLSDIEALLALAEPREWKELSDSEWANIVHRDYSYHDYDSGDIPREVFKLTNEALRAKNGYPE